MNAEKRTFAVVGTGPAGLMAAHVLARAGHSVDLFEKRAGLGRKLLIAGSSGLNITHDLPLKDFAAHYFSPTSPPFFTENLRRFPAERWVAFLEETLSLETFLGTSGRYFVREMKASQLLKNWTRQLESAGVVTHPRSELTDFEANAEGVKLVWGEDRSRTYAGAVLALGGGSWEDSPVVWPEIFRRKGVAFTDFSPANVGYEVAWPAKFLAEALRQPLKSITFRSARGMKAGELLITEYGLEGTPVYFYGTRGTAFIDLKPALTAPEIFARLQGTRENLSPIRRVDRLLGLSSAAFALVFHLADAAVKSDLRRLSEFIKAVPIELQGPRPLAEAISSRGGVQMGELSGDLELKRAPGIFLAGEMLDWDAPTGGFLIQASVLQGVVAAEGLLARTR